MRPGLTFRNQVGVSIVTEETINTAAERWIRYQEIRTEQPVYITAGKLTGQQKTTLLTIKNLERMTLPACWVYPGREQIILASVPLPKIFLPIICCLIILAQAVSKIRVHLTKVVMLLILILEELIILSTSKYLFTVTGRADGSSKFGDHHKLLSFPSAAFAWRAF